MNNSGPNAHQEFQPFPQLGTPIVDPETGEADASWYRLLISFWQKLGGKFSEQTTAVFAQQTGPTSVVLRNAQTGVQIGGTVSTEDGKGLLLSAIAEPETPALGTARLYLDVATDKVSVKSDTGVVTPLN